MKQLHHCAECGDLYTMVDGWTEHSFILRPETTIRLTLPTNLSRVESERLARFIQTLSFEV